MHEFVQSNECEAIKDERDDEVREIANLHNDARAEIARLTADVAAKQALLDEQRAEIADLGRDLRASIKEAARLRDTVPWQLDLAIGRKTDGWTDAIEAVRALAAARSAPPATVGGLLATAPVARPLSEWNDDHGDVLWWRFPIDEPPYCGSPLADDWPGYHTHWTPIVCPADPATRGELPGGEG